MKRIVFEEPEFELIHFNDRYAMANDTSGVDEGKVDGSNLPVGGDDD